MSPFVWSPSWHRPGESLWAALNKVAFATDTSVAKALMFMTGLSATAVRGATLATEPRIAVLVCTALQLAFNLAGQLLAGIGPLPLSVRQYLQLGLRWCPQCLACGGFHSARFQDWRLEQCPWHECPLLDRCPACRSAIDPLCEQAWCCNACGQALYEPRRRWLADFKAVPPFLGDTTAPMEPFVEVVTAPGLIHFIRTGPVTEGAGRGLLDREADVLITQAACEELSALTDTVLAGYRESLASHAHVSMLQCELVRFSCPVAAAAVRVAAWTGVGAFSLESGWASSDRPPAHLVHRALQWELDQMPAWCRRLFVQACVRAWLVDAVNTFRAAERTGQPGQWRPTEDATPAWFFKDGTFTVNKTPDIAALSCLGAAGRPCAAASAF